MYCLEQRDEMPALPEEVAEALAEEIAIENGWGPRQILTDAAGKVVGLELIRCTRVFAENGRFAPEYDENETCTVAADHILISVGQEVVWGDLLTGLELELNRNQTVVADPTTYQTKEPDIFVGGDVYTGPKFAIDAIAAGKEGAISIHRYVQPGQSLVLGRLIRDYKPLDPENVDFEGFDMKPRQKIETHAGAACRKSFRDMRGSFQPEQIKLEADRCLSCGKAYVDSYVCIGCGQCTTKCRFDAIALERVTDVAGVEVEKLKPYVLKNIVRTKSRRTMNRLKKSVKNSFRSK